MRYLLGIFFVIVSTVAYTEDFAVVVNKNSSVNSLDKRQVANIFLAKMTRIRGNGRVTPLELHDTAFQAHFYHEISGKTLSQINSYWTTLIFTGKGRPPKKIAEINQLIEAINSNPHAITYLPVDHITGSMKIVHRVQ